eukprot:CAMPEP_0197073864 /NCGR_PEP_ID=MMETSP1384-20130603/210822_1 /TAXON_ID=29189 /ORGANISM="Ammonia sp." /LENGTH=559 /DNA_ID=CAMNT_0042512705 /DNA_START=31 /DNA_END=1708 /DNA_ORIENTATION=-
MLSSLTEEKFTGYDSMDNIKSHLSITGHPPRKLSILQITTIMFTLTSGGPFGIEEAVQSGGILYTLIGLIAISFLYSLPQALMCSELGSMMPSYHGYIIWVYRAFGDVKYVGNFIGFFNSIAEIFAMGTDIPIYPVIMSYYFEQLIKTHFTSFSFTFWTAYTFKVCMILLGAIFNIFNIKIIGNSTIIFSVIIVLPFLIGFVYSVQNTDVSTWLSVKPYNDSNEMQWGVFISSLLWLNNGWDSVGSLTAELNFPRSRIFCSFLMAIIFVYISYTVSILGALTVPCDDKHTACWDDGYLYTAYDKMSVLLGLFIVIAGFMANFSMYMAELSVQARLLWSLCQPAVVLLDDGTMYVQTHENKYVDDDMYIIDFEKLQMIGNDTNDASCRIKQSESAFCHTLCQPAVVLLDDGTMYVQTHENKYVDDDMYIIDFEKLQMHWQRHKRRKLSYQTIRIGILPHWLGGTLWSKTGAPVRGVILQSAVSAVLILFDFSTLLQGTVLINAITWCLEFLSFIMLRYKEPNTRRPYKVPGGMCVAWLITLDKLILVGFVMFLIIYDTPW